MFSRPLSTPFRSDFPGMRFLMGFFQVHDGQLRKQFRLEEGACGLYSGRKIKALKMVPGILKEPLLVSDFLFLIRPKHYAQKYTFPFTHWVNQKSFQKHV